MKTFLIIIFACVAFHTGAQNLFVTDTGRVRFYSEAPVEDIEAVNKTVRSLINPDTRDIAVIVTIPGFKFDKALMEEHFNENYMESHKFPTAKFKGKIDQNIDLSKDGKHEVTCTGTLEVHGVEKKRTLNGTLEVKDGRIHVHTKFEIALVDHDIEIPTAVIKNIAEIIEVTTDISYKPKEKSK